MASPENIATAAQQQSTAIRNIEARYTNSAARPLASALQTAHADATNRWLLAATPQGRPLTTAQLEDLVAHIRKLLDAAFHGRGRQAMQEAQRAAYTAAALGARQASAIVTAMRGTPPPHVDPDTGLLAERTAAGIPQAVQEEHGHALALLTTASLTAFGLAGLNSVFSRARRAVTRITQAVAVTVASAAAAAATAVARALGPDVVLLWVAEPGACPACAAYAGRSVKPGQRFPGGLSLDPKRTVFLTAITGPPRHPHCFPAGTVVSGPGASAATRRWYSGEMVRVRTRKGHVLTGTPNHPVLTPQGWVPLGGLDEGSDVVSDTRLKRMLAVDPDDYQKPALIEDVARSLGGDGGMLAERMPLTSEDFHGDGADGYVEVIYADGLLRDRTQVQQQIPQTFLSRAAGHTSLLATHSDGSTMLESLGDSAHRSVSSFCIPPVLFGSSLRHAQPVGFQIAAGFNTSPAEPAINNVSTHAKIARDLIDALASQEAVNNSFDLRQYLDPDLNSAAPQESGDRLGADAEAPSDGPDALAEFVTRDQVISVERFPWSGHVYNLETSGGWYIANGIVVHNCRCVLIPWNSEWQQKNIRPPLPVVLQRRARQAARAGRH